MAAQECTAYCPRCTAHTIFRAAPGRPWFCTACGTPNDPMPVVVRTSLLARFLYLLTFLGTLFALWIIALACASGSVEARCTDICSLTVTNGSFWPVRLDTGSITVDGRHVRGFGSTFAGPFGSTTIRLYDLTGTGIAQAGTIRYIVGPLGTWDRTVHTLVLRP